MFTTRSDSGTARLANTKALSTENTAVFEPSARAMVRTMTAKAARRRAKNRSAVERSRSSEFMGCASVAEKRAGRQAQRSIAVRDTRPEGVAMGQGQGGPAGPPAGLKRDRSAA